MHRTILIILAAAALLLSACSDMGSGMSSGSGGGITPPVQANAAGSPGGMHASASPGQPTATPSAPPGDTATYSLADASNGIRCPDVNGYSCIVHLNVPVPTASPGKGAATPSPSPTPSPSVSSSPAPSPTPTPSLTLHLEEQTKDAPAMVNPDTKAVATEALIALRVTANADVTLSGKTSVDFILPQGQMGGRSFALQLFHETNGRHGRHSDTFIGSYSKATATDTTLHYEVTPPQVTTKRGETWLLVLYANEQPSATVSPTTSPTPTASASP